MKKEYHYGFQISRKIVFEVSYYTLGSNKNPYFTTSAAQFNQPKTDFNRCGQAQDSLLTGKAREFWLKWDKNHLKNLSKADYTAILADIEDLKATYNYIVDEKDTFAGTNSGLSFRRLKELSMQKVKA